MSAAVAFVTPSGARWLLELLEPLNKVHVELIAQAGGVTSPEALQDIRDHLGAEVSVVIGRDSARFHPKLWLVRGDHELVVLAGSGNLTQGGLEQNVEQFELTRLPIESEEARAQEERFLELTADAYSLDKVEGSVAWKVWEQTITKLKSARSQMRMAERELSETPFIEEPKREREGLLADLYAIYEATAAKDMITPKGKLYRPTRFLTSINKAADSGDPFELVRSLCRRQTGGFDIILAYDEPYLTVESLVVNEKKSYHHLFTAKTKELAAARLEQFPGWVT